MGLDQWLVARTNLELDKEATGVCSGMFPITLVADDEYELGYLRKAYDQEEVILNHVVKSVEQDEYLLDKAGISDIIDEARLILDTHTFDEDGADVDSDISTWRSKQKWENVIEMFSKALEVLDKDSRAEIIYKEWY